MLQALVAYALQQELLTQKGYAPKEVRWVVDLTADGTFLGLIELGSPDKKRNPGIRFGRAPDLAHNELIAGGITRSHFLIDTMGVVIPPGPGEEMEKNAAKHAYFLQLLMDASEVLPTLEAAIKFFRDLPQVEKLREAAQEQNASLTDKATVRIAGQFPVEDPRWYPWWDKFRVGLTTANATTAVCLMTGKTGPFILTHPKITGLMAVGGNSAGSALVSFDKPAFMSYGLDQGANAPMLEEAAVSYAQALVQLIAKAPTFGDIKILHWFAERLPDNTDPFAFLEMPEDRVGQEGIDEGIHTLSAIRLGTRPNALSLNRFYAMLVSAVSGRIMVRGWYEGTYETLRNHIAQWFDDMAIVSVDGSLAKTPAFWQVLAALKTKEQRAEKRKSHHSALTKALWESAAFNRSIPRQAVQMALVHIRQAMLGLDPTPVYAYGVLKAFLIRQKQEGQNMSQALDPERPEVAYHAGRLLAVMGRLQSAANPGVNSDVVTRFYNAASTSPALTFGRLNSLARYHLNKLDSGGLRFWFEGELAQVMAQIHDFPTTLSLSDQSLFALGYYHQLAYYRSQNNQNKEGAEHHDDDLTKSL